MNLKYNLLKTHGFNSWEFQLFQSSQETIENLYAKYPNDPQISQEYARRANENTYANQSEISLELVILVLQRYPGELELNRLYQKRKVNQELNYNPLKFYSYCASFPLALGVSTFSPGLALGLAVVGYVGLCFNIDYYLNKDSYPL